MRNFQKLLAAGIIMISAMMPFNAFAALGTSTIRIAAVQSAYDNIAISQVTNYVNVRSEPNTGSTIVGKIYNNCAATILETVAGEGGGWYRIESGNVSGYVKAEFFVTGDEAEKIAKNIGTVYVTIDTDDLRLRSEPNLDSSILTLLSKDDEYIEIGEDGEFFHVQVDADLDGYVHKDYCYERVEFKQAESLEEEAAESAEAAQRRQEADDAIAFMEKLKSEGAEGVGLIPVNPEDEGQETSDAAGGEAEAGAGENDSSETSDTGETSTSTGTDVGSTSGPGSSSSGSSSGSDAEIGPGITPIDSTNFETSELTSATRAAVVAYAKQFIGNPYVYGGTSLTEGADCSGFVMRVFEHFGIDTGRTSRDQAANGKQVSIDNVQPGDLIFYASGDYINHVAIYIGDGQIIHSSTPATGIMISTMYYRTPYMAATFLD